MKVVGKNGRVYWTWSKEKYNEARKKSRQARHEEGLCQDCPNMVSCNTRSSLDNRPLHCKECKKKKAAAQKRRRDGKSIRKTNSYSDSGNTR